MIPISDPPGPTVSGYRSHLTILALERLAAADLAGGEQQAAARHLDGCAACRERLAGLRADALRFAARDDLPSRIDALQRAAPAAARRRIATWGAAAALATGAAALVVALRPVGGEPVGLAMGPDGRRKGGEAIDIVRRTSEGRIAELAAGDVVHPGDAIRFRVITPTAGFVGVLGIDSAGAITPYAPDGETLQPIAAGRPLVFEGSIVLDETLGPELIVAAFCLGARPLSELRAEAAAALSRAAGDPRRIERATSCREVTFLLEKEAP